MARKRGFSVDQYARARRSTAVPGMVKCHGTKCPNGGMTSLLSDDTLVVKGKAYCSVCSMEVEGNRKD